MKGTYKGSYWYTNGVSNTLKELTTKFQLHIETEVGTKITGTVEDDVASGGTPGVGTIEGDIHGNTITFVKQMPVVAFFSTDGSMVTGKKPHKPIYYKGTIDAATGTIHGTWKLKFGITFHKGRLLIIPTTKGTWEMQLVSPETKN